MQDMDKHLSTNVSSKVNELELNQLLKSFTNIRSALDQSTILAITDHRGRINFVNDKFCKISKYTKEELLGKDHRILNSGYHSKEFFKEMWSTISRGETWKGEIQNRAKDGSLYWVNTTIVPFLNEKGKPYQYIAIRADITNQKKAEKDLEKMLKHDFYLTMKNLHSGIFKIRKTADENYIYTLMEGKYFEKINLTTNTVYGKTPFDLFPFQQAEFIHSQNKKAFEGQKVKFESNIKKRIFYIELSPIFQDEIVIEVVGSISDITELKSTKEKLWMKEQSFQSIIEHHTDAVVKIDINGHFIETNPITEQITGYSQEELAGTSFTNIVKGEYLEETLYFFNKVTQGEVQNYNTEIVRKNGESLYLNVTSIPIVINGQMTEIYSLAKDITEQKKIQESNAFWAYHDSLTGLPNRRWLDEKLKKEVIAANKNNYKLAVLYLDLDRFKSINDTLGHPIGDKLLEQIAARMNKLIPSKSHLGRMGGDEFMILTPLIESVDELIEFAKNLLDNLEKPFFIGEYELYVTASAGISIYPMDGQSAEDLMKHADIALYRAKDQGRNNFQIYSTSMNARTFQSFLLEKDLRKAFIGNELELYYQPRVDSKTGEILSAEALLRWNHPQLGIVLPSEFIPLAEETGLIININKWVKRKVCEQLAKWREVGIPILPISINMHSQQFLEKDFLKNVSELLEQYQLEGKWFEFEITENTIMRNEEIVIQTFNELRRMGIKIFIDDFGTGYSSFSYLKSFKFDGIKIDRSFISNISNESENSAITSGMIKMAQYLKMIVVAEGVETEEELLFLRGQNCEQIQGFLFSKPVPPEDFERLLLKVKLLPITQKNEVIENRRKYFRIGLDYPLAANMSIVKIHDKNVEVGKSEVLIENIGPGGLRFLSNLKLLVHPKIIFSFETQILGEHIQLYGKIIWNNKCDDGINQYGLEFVITEKQLTYLTKLLNNFSLKLRKSSLAPDSRFIKIDKSDFFKLLQ
jgi:diguanylate cyclase (GGDEF)-like protein/PAS domain S-box-containing protein